MPDRIVEFLLLHFSYIEQGNNDLTPPEFWQVLDENRDGRSDNPEAYRSLDIYPLPCQYIQPSPHPLCEVISIVDHQSHKFSNHEKFVDVAQFVEEDHRTFLRRIGKKF